MQLYQGGGLTQGTPKATTGDIFKLSCIAITNTVFARQNRTSILLKKLNPKKIDCIRENGIIHKIISSVGCQNVIELTLTPGTET